MNTTPEAPAPEAATIDVRDMVVVHTALLREFRLAGAAVHRAHDGTRKQVDAVLTHLELMCALLHHHHTGEDELLWPVLAPRLSAAERALVDVAESQHAGIEKALVSVETARARWAKRRDEQAADDLVTALDRLHELVREHLEAEERYLLPLAAAHLTASEWGAIGQAGAASTPKSAMLLVFGMFAYEGDPEILAMMLHAAPPPVRFLVPRLAPRVYARYAARVHGTRRP